VGPVAHQPQSADTSSDRAHTDGREESVPVRAPGDSATSWVRPVTVDTVLMMMSSSSLPDGDHPADGHPDARVGADGLGDGVPGSFEDRSGDVRPGVLESEAHDRTPAVRVLERRALTGEVREGQDAA